MAIKVTVKLFGTLGLNRPGYNHKKGLQIDTPDKVTVEDLLYDLNIPLHHIGFISDGSQALQFDSHLKDKMNISFYSLISGG